ncbi:MAG: hypothetical protein KAJ44_00295 [Thermoplasmatales archaeon]|nr:hypothetical protein [Thermoplasmatales archaeon]
MNGIGLWAAIITLLAAVIGLVAALIKVWHDKKMLKEGLKKTYDAKELELKQREIDNKAQLERQKLVTGRNHNLRFAKFFERLVSRNQPKSDTNINCQITGKATEIDSIRLSNIMILTPWIKAVIFIWCPLSWITALKNLAFGYSIDEMGWPTDYEPSLGWIHTDGLNGVLTWEGKFFGTIKKINPPSFVAGWDIYYHLGATFFIGFKIITHISWYYESYIMGRAFRVELESFP